MPCLRSNDPEGLKEVLEVGDVPGAVVAVVFMELEIEELAVTGPTGKVVVG